MKKLLYGQIGGTMSAFIGEVHRKAIAIDGMAVLVAGCFSASNAKANLECGEHYDIAPERIYSNYKEMAEAEAGKLDFVVICTPNDTHYAIAKAFMEKDIHVVCEKPLCFTSEQARELEAIAAQRKLLTCVTYTYTGYNMVKQARQMIAEGLIGRILDVKGEYLQDWLHSQAWQSGDQNVWRMNPKYSGIVNSVGDIGTHIEQTVAFMTGLRVSRLCAMMDCFGQRLDLNANILVEFEGGTHGSFACSQIALGHYNGLVIRVFGTEGAIEWEQERPDFLRFTPKGKPTQILTRGAHTWGHASDINRIPCGHPEGLTLAFSNIYKSFAQALNALKEGKQSYEEICAAKSVYDFPTIHDGVMGVRFIEACVKSNSEGSSWVNM